MNSNNDVDRLREVFTAFDPVRGSKNPAAVQAPEVASNAPPRAPERASARWSRVTLVAAAVVAAIVVPVAVVNSFDAAPSTASSALASGPAAAAVADYGTMMADRDVIQRAEQELIRRCMAAASFEYTPIEQLPARWRQLTQPLSVQAASETGYASVTAPLTSPSAQANEKYFAALSKAEQQRYLIAIRGGLGDAAQVTGAAGTVSIPTTGCTRQADRDLFGDGMKWTELSLSISHIVGSVPLDGDGALMHATQQWSTCMEGRGYGFAEPAAAMQLAFSKSTPSNRLDANGNEVPEETAGADPDGARHIAVADATCRAQTGWDDANRDATQRALAAALTEHESDVLAYKEMATAGVAKARTVLGQ